MRAVRSKDTSPELLFRKSLWSKGYRYNIHSDTDCANTETMFRVIQSIQSPKVEPLKRGLARVGKEWIDEIENPELSMARIQELLTGRIRLV